MASFYKRGDYQWEAKIRKAGFPQLARTFESKSDAMAWAARVLLLDSSSATVATGGVTAAGTASTAAEALTMPAPHGEQVAGKGRAVDVRMDAT